MSRTAGIVLASLLGISSLARADQLIWVGPNGAYANRGTTPSDPTTLEGARDQIRTLHAKGLFNDNVQVILLGGVYYRTEPFVLSGEQDSGTAQYRITYRASGGSGGAGYADVMIHGGSVPIWGWVQGPPVGGGVQWTADLDADDGGGKDADTPGYSFRELYYRNRRLIRARFPNVGENSTGIENGAIRVGQGWDATLGGGIPARGYQFTNFVDHNGRTVIPGLTAAGAPVEMVALLDRAWTTPRQILGGATYGPGGTPPTNIYFRNSAPIGRITTGAQAGAPLCVPCGNGACPTTCPACPCEGWTQCHSLQVRAAWPNDPWCPVWDQTTATPCYFENNVAFVDSLFEWHFNETTHIVTVVLPPMENPNNPDYEVVYPIATQLLTATNIQFVTFTRLNWGFARFDLPPDGYNPAFGGYTSITNTLITTGAIQMLSEPAGPAPGATSDVEFSKCRIAHVGATALQIDGDRIRLEGNKIFDVGAHGIIMGNRAQWNVPAAAGSYNVVTQNQVLGFGRTYHDSLGIFGNVQQDLLVQANEVGCGGYGGIGLGVANVVEQQENAFNIEIFNNRVHHVCRVVPDGAAIGEGGGMANCGMDYNYIYGMPTGNGIGFDQGAWGPWVLWYNIMEGCAHPVGFHTAACVPYHVGCCTSPSCCSPGGACFPEPFNTNQFTWNYNYCDLHCDLNPEHLVAAAWNAEHNQNECLPLTYFDPAAPPSGVDYFRHGSGVRCDQNYPFQFTNRQIDPPGTVPCPTWPPSCDEYQW